MNIATVSTSGNQAMGSLIAKAFEKVGDTGSTVVEESQTFGLRVPVLLGAGGCGLPPRRRAILRVGPLLPHGRARHDLSPSYALHRERRAGRDRVDADLPRHQAHQFGDAQGDQHCAQRGVRPLHGDAAGRGGDGHPAMRVYGIALRLLGLHVHEDLQAVSEEIVRSGGAVRGMY